MQLQALGKPTSSQLGAPEEAERIYTISEAIRLKVDADLSDRNLFNVPKRIRYIFGRKSIQSGIKAALFQHKNTFSDLFAVKKIPVESLLQSSQPILLTCPPPPLHIKLGVVKPAYSAPFCPSSQPCERRCGDIGNRSKGLSWKVFRRAPVL